MPETVGVFCHYQIGIPSGRRPVESSSLNGQSFGTAFGNGEKAKKTAKKAREKRPRPKTPAPKTPAPKRTKVADTDASTKKKLASLEKQMAALKKQLANKDVP